MDYEWCGDGTDLGEEVSQRVATGEVICMHMHALVRREHSLAHALITGKDSIYIFSLRLFLFAFTTFVSLSPPLLFDDPACAIE